MKDNLEKTADLINRTVFENSTLLHVCQELDLDPKSHFSKINLEGLDLRNQNARDFDFSESDINGVLLNSKTKVNSSNKELQKATLILNLNQDLKEIFQSRFINILNSLGINKLDDLMRISIHKFSIFPGIGRKAKQELIDYARNNTYSSDALIEIFGDASLSLNGFCRILEKNVMESDLSKYRNYWSHAKNSFSNEYYKNQYSRFPISSYWSNANKGIERLRNPIADFNSLKFPENLLNTRLNFSSYSKKSAIVLDISVDQMLDICTRTELLSNRYFDFPVFYLFVENWQTETSD